MTAHRSRRLLMGAALVLASLAAAGCGSASGSDGSSLEKLPPGQIVSAALGQASQAHSVAWTSRITGPHAMLVRSHAAAKAGHQTLTIDGANVDIALVGSTAYLRGSAAGLEKFGFPKSLARGLANHWLAYGKSDKGFDSLAGGLTLGSVLSELGLTGDLQTTGVSTIRGRRVIGVRGMSTTDSGTKAVLYVALDGPPLPVEMVMTRGGQRTEIVLSGWGESVKTARPSPATPVAQVGKLLNSA